MVGLGNRAGLGRAEQRKIQEGCPTKDQITTSQACSGLWIAVVLAAEPIAPLMPKLMAQPDEASDIKRYRH